MTAADLEALAALVAPLVAKRLRRRNADEYDSALLVAIAEWADGTVFTAHKIATEHDELLLAAADNADLDLDDEHAIGTWLRGMTESMVGPATLERLGTRRPGQWIFR